MAYSILESLMLKSTHGKMLFLSVALLAVLSTLAGIILTRSPFVLLLPVALGMFYLSLKFIP